MKSSSTSLSAVVVVVCIRPLRFLLVCTFVVALMSSTVGGQSSEDDLRQVTGTADRGVTISCREDISSTSAPHQVEWLSHAWSSSRDPLYIFRSVHNPQFNVETEHPNAEHYVVDQQYRLTITSINIQEDPGIYICRVITSSGDEREHRYHLNVATTPSCRTSVATGEPGSPTQLTCTMQYSANQPPTITWYAGEDEELEGADHSEPRTAQRDTRRTLTIDDDRRPFRCVAQLGNIQESCQVIVEVPHSAQGTKLTPTESVLHVSDELRCTTSGNPSPQLTFSPPDAAAAAQRGESGDRWRTLVIPDSWIGQRHNVTCTAVNEVDGQQHSDSASVAFNVVDAARPAGGHAATVRQTSAVTTLLVITSLLLR